VREAVRAPEVIGGVWAEVAQRILAGYLVVIEAPAPVGAEHHRAAAVGADHQEADPGLVDKGVDQAGVQRFDLGDRQSVVDLRQGDQPEAARGQNHSGVFRRVSA
jgi:hypothetical protein